jgi:hypothetical protein
MTGENAWRAAAAETCQAPVAGWREAGAASGRRWWQGAAQALERRQQDGHQGLLEEKGSGAALPAAARR